MEKTTNEELNDLYSLPNIFRVIKSRIMRRTWHVGRIGERRGLYRVLVGKPEGKRPLARPRSRGEGNRWIFRKWDVGVWSESIWLRIGTGGQHF